MHVAGVVRALSGALDCLAGTIIGVVALPRSILRANFNSVRKQLRSIQDVSTDGGRHQAKFGRTLEDLIGSVGPDGWLDWMLAFRNMLVHRGRRTELGQYVPKQTLLYGPDGQPVLRAHRVTHLPRDPARSDVEVFLYSPHTLVLTEDAAQTLHGLLVSTKSLIERAAYHLKEVWIWRRARPQGLPQPEAQWPNCPANEPIRFSGYNPGTFEFSPSMAMMHPVLARRFRSAALDDESRRHWDSFE